MASPHRQSTTVPPAVVAAYTKAQSEWVLRSAFEANIRSEQGKVDAAGADDVDDGGAGLAAARSSLSLAWVSYYTFEQRAGGPARAALVLQRAVCSCFWDSDLWLRLGAFVGDVVGDKPGAVAVYRRGVRNCLWSSDLWVALLRALERCGSGSGSGVSGSGAAGDVDTVAQEALHVAFYSVQDYVAVRGGNMCRCRGVVVRRGRKHQTAWIGIRVTS